MSGDFIYAADSVHNILGILLSLLAGTMLAPMALDLMMGDPNWQSFAIAALFTGFVGVCLWLAFNRSEQTDLGLKEAFLLTNGAWLFIGLFGALPLFLSSLSLSLTDAVFESISGITTTGSAILREIEQASYGILLWRALLQWLGGVGIIVMALAIFPMLRLAGCSFSKQRALRPQTRLSPARQLAGGIFAVYTGLTLLWTIMLMLAGMPFFDAMTHAMTTLATGGYSTVQRLLARLIRN